MGNPRESAKSVVSVSSTAESRFKDRRFLGLAFQIIDHNAPRNARGKGVPIGNVTGQHFANLCLDRLDHFAKEDSRVGRYVRYMDDALCFADDTETPNGVLVEFERFPREELDSRLKERKCFAAPVSQGIPFLGSRVFPGTPRLGRPGLVRCRGGVTLR